MKNDSYTRFVARAAARQALGAGLPFLRTQEHALRVARSDFGYGAPPFKGGFNTELARDVITVEFAAAAA